MKKLPYGISNYEKLIKENYYYVDKTSYIEKLEKLPETYIIFLRPRKFGKTLFTSMLEYYYDINETEKFKELFEETYIGKNPTNKKNSYHILRFNFSGIDTSSFENTLKGFKSSVKTSIYRFINMYNIDFNINDEQDPEEMLNSLFEAFLIQKYNEKIYVIIDEYDHFANELLSFQTNDFKNLFSRNGKVRKWYEILKKGTESVVDRIFITGVTPITLDSMTSGFNIGTDKTRELMFNEMLGFTTKELEKMMDDLEIPKEKQEELFPIMKENYDGYKFSIDAEEKVYNSNMCLYFLNKYVTYNRIPRSLIDVNIASDYSKLANMLRLCKSERKKEILEKTISNEGIETSIIEKFNPEIGYEENEFASMLFYLGYLTIAGEILNKSVLKIPNTMMREIYSSYFIKVLSDETELRTSEDDYNQALKEVALEGRIDKIVEITEKYLKKLSNRDAQRFDEKYVKIIFFCIAMNMSQYSIKSEQEVERLYPDILMVPIDKNENYQSVMIEFKYLKAGEKNKLEAKQKEAREQILQYSKLEDIVNIKNLNMYTIVAVNDELYVENINKIV